jgi:hypothetical protein
MIDGTVMQVCKSRLWSRNPRPKPAGEKLCNHDQGNERAKRRQDRPYLQQDARFSGAKYNGVKYANRLFAGVEHGVCLFRLGNHITADLSGQRWRRRKAGN